ncbi:hypothetical protein B0I37DRAFT_358996 [Chaetomium sp. MPI-CAGE-AT-0009]|nr:hypothetical protein B0I37DRAFT_358996 [Chaetomium sp. MPI-CAGE-AT-0009]
MVRRRALHLTFFIFCSRLVSVLRQDGEAPHSSCLMPLNPSLRNLPLHFSPLFFFFWQACLQPCFPLILPGHITSPHPVVLDSLSSHIPTARHQGTMRLSSPALWPFLASLAWFGNVVGAAGVLEVDLVFPRTNETYAPRANMPIVFGFRNAKLAQHLRPIIQVTIRGNDDIFYSETMRSVNWTSAEPLFEYTFIRDMFTNEGQWWIFWELYWTSCAEDEDGVFSGETITNHTSRRTAFTIKDDGQVFDLVAITANDETCPEEQGVAINVTDTTTNVSRPHDGWSLPWTPHYTCVAVASSTPTPTPNPCLVKIDSAVDASISVALHRGLCNNWNDTDNPEDCPPGTLGGPPKNAAQQLAVVGLGCLAAAFGGVLFLFI